MLWMCRVAVPFSYAASKNHIWSMARSGHVYKRQESKRMRGSLTLMIRSAANGQRIANNKLWIDILVQKPDHKGDAVNVVDLVCDSIKDAIDLDDRWYSIRCLDWEIVKDRPRLFVGIGQSTDEDVQVCSSCGRMLPLDNFTKKRSQKLGVDRNCRACLKDGRARAKAHGTPHPG